MAQGEKVYTTIAVLIIVNIVMALAVLWKMAKNDNFFTRLESGNLKFVVKGETYAKTISEDEDPNWFGLYWVGIYPFSQIHEFEILVDKEDPNAKEVKDWVKKPGVKKKTKSLRKIIPRPVLMLNTELEVGKSTVDILLSLIFEVVDGKKFVFDMKADFTPVVSVIQTEVINILKGVGLDQFLNTHGGDQSQDLLVELISYEFNNRLDSLFGLHLRGAGISNLQVSDLRLRQAMESEQVAIREGNATRKQAEAEADALFIKARKQADAIKTVGNAKNEILQGSVDALLGLSANGAQVLASENIGKAIEVAKPNTVIVGGNPIVNTPINPERR